MHAGEVPGIPPEYRGINYDVSSNFRDGDKSYSSPPRLISRRIPGELTRGVTKRNLDFFERGWSAPATGIFFDDS
jgi:hypothetical protein